MIGESPYIDLLSQATDCAVVRNWPCWPDGSRGSSSLVPRASGFPAFRCCEVRRRARQRDRGKCRSRRQLGSILARRPAAALAERVVNPPLALPGFIGTSSSLRAAFSVSAFRRAEPRWRINVRLAVSNGGTGAEGPRGLGMADPTPRWTGPTPTSAVVNSLCDQEEPRPGTAGGARASKLPSWRRSALSSIRRAASILRSTRALPVLTPERSRCRSDVPAAPICKAIR